MFTVGILLTNVNGGGTLRHAKELATAWMSWLPCKPSLR